MPDVHYFTVREARELLPALMEPLGEFVSMRADLTEAISARASDDRSDSPAMALADLKALEAHINEILDSIAEQGVHVKGFAPLLLDFPVQHEGRELLLCWVEGEPSLEWYHDAALGFAGRRPIADLDI